MHALLSFTETFPAAEIWHLSVVIGLIGCGMIGLSVHRKVHRKWKADSARYNLTLHMGVALIVASVTVSVVELSVSRHFSRQQRDFMEQLKQTTLPVELEAVVGRALAEELRKQILTQPVRYHDFAVVGRIETVDPPGSGRRYVRADFTTTVIVENTAGAPIEYALKNRLSDVRPDRYVGFKSLQFTRVDETGRPIGKALLALDNEVALRSLVKRPSPTEAVLDTTLLLQAHGRYKLVLRKVFTDDSNSYFNLRTRYACEGMRLQIEVPADLQVDCEFGYPYASDDAEFQKDDHRVSATLRSTLLPYQGVFIVWRDRYSRR